jgi:hypothetical protein
MDVDIAIYEKEERQQHTVTGEEEGAASPAPARWENAVIDGWRHDTEDGATAGRETRRMRMHSRREMTNLHRLSPPMQIASRICSLY